MAVESGATQEVTQASINDYQPNPPLSSDEFPSSPGPVRVIEPVEEEHTFRLNEDFLRRILLDPKVADKKVSIISVAGAFRKGKSFLLNFFLRYLNHRTKLEKVQEHVDDSGWLESEPRLVGFSWRGGSERDTNGILMWSEPFIVRDRNGEEIVVILMDTQGAFDSLSTVKDCATIFALSTMISSVQIFNISQNIQEDDLQHLQLFTEYGRLALENNGEAKPFQALLFVVRDWSFPYDAEYGFLGGQRILDKRLEISEKQHPELQQIRKHIRTSFEKIECFLMPHPGLEVATSQHFRGQLESIHDDFKKHLRTLVPRLLDTNNLVLKSINGQAVTCRELLEYFKAYTEIFHGEQLPEPKSMLAATAEANNLAAVSSSKAHYVRQMEEVCGGDAPYMNTNSLEEEHLRCRGEAIRVFKQAKKMGGAELSLQFLDRLEQDIEESYESFVKVNNSKNLFKSMRTPAVLVMLMIFDYILQEFFQLIGLNTIASFFSMILMIAILALSTWAYSRYSGNLRDVGHSIDEAVQWAWENFFSHAAEKAIGPATQIGFRLNEMANSTASTTEGRKRR